MDTSYQPRGQPRSQGLSSLPPLVVGIETLFAAGHVTIYPSKTAGWVGTQVHLVERTIKYHPVVLPFQQIFRDQSQPGPLSQRLREADKRDPGNEVAPWCGRHLTHAHKGVSSLHALTC